MERTPEKGNGIPLALLLTVLRFSEEGQGERESFSYAATYREAGDDCTLAYCECPDADMPSAAAETLISFKRGTPCVVKIQKNGAICTEMRFAEGEAFAAEYRIPGLGSFPAAGRTRRVSNTVAAGGGRLLLDYELTVGGARTRTVMTLAAAPAVPDAALCEQKRETEGDRCR